MRLTQKKIEEIMLSILGEEGLPLVKELTGRENVSEFELADKIKKDIKIVRKMLYLLYNHNLVSFTRKKDKQKGWYIYYWTLLPEGIKFNYIKKKKELLEALNQRLEEESKDIFFVCPNNCVRLNFDQGMDFEFHCPECGELISQDENREMTEHLKKRINDIKQEIEELLEKRKERRKKIKDRKKEVRIKKRSIRKSLAKNKTATKPKKIAKKTMLRSKVKKKSPKLKKK